MEFGEEYLMAMEREHRKEAKDHTDLTHFDIKITVEGIGLEIIINASDPLDCVVLAGYVIKKLQEMDKEPTVVILP